MSTWQEQISDPAGMGVDHGEGENAAMDVTDTVLRRYIDPDNVEHRCVLPRGGPVGPNYRWQCPVCRGFWSVNGRGSGSGDCRQPVGTVIAFVMRYPDGTTEAFHIEPQFDQ